jgi:lipoate---protein ligase
MIWRLIPLIEASGHVQMAIDKWLLEEHLAGNQPPSLRFYTWSSPTISLGYHQTKYPEHWQQLIWQEKKLELVKRPTGGRAVLHQGDLTYAVVISKASSNRMEAYQEICKFLIAGCKNLGVDLRYGTAGRGYIHNPNCFGTATAADLVTVDGYKLIGSAQLRKGNVILQHGSIRLQPDAKLFGDVFGEVFTPMPVLQDINIEMIVDCLVAAAGDCFDVQFDVRPLSTDEWERILF